MENVEQKDLQPQQHVDRLAEARAADQRSAASSQENQQDGEDEQTRANLLKNAGSLLSNVQILSDMPYFVALGAAMLKDLLDLIFVGSLPLIGTAITVCCSIFIAMMLFLAGTNSKTGKKARRLAKSKTFQKTMIRMLALIFGTVIEFVPGVDFFPVESMIVGIIYFWELRDRRNEA
jgi:hypothetical protein